MTEIKEYSRAYRRLTEGRSPEEIKTIAHDFVRLFAERAELSRVPAVLRDVQNELDKTMGRIRVTVETPVSLSENDRKSLISEIRQRTEAQEVLLRELIVPDLIEGIRITMGWTKVDSTLSSRLKALRQQL